MDEDPRKPLSRLSRLLDDGWLAPLHPPDSSNVQTVRGRIGNIDVIAYCTDGSTMGGALGQLGGQRIAAAIDLAVRERCPVIGLWHSGGAQLAEGISSLDGIGRVFAAMIGASGRVPQISVVLGTAAGGAAYGAALTDLVIMAPEGRMFVTGPSVIRSVTGEEIGMDELGGGDAHGRGSGVVHVLAASEADACARARRLTRLLASPGCFRPTALPAKDDLSGLIPDNPRRAYDIRPIVSRLVDEGTFEEVQPLWAPSIVIGLGRLTGRTIGVIANNPIRRGGCLDTLSSEKAARFVRMCDSFGIPLLVLVDVPGYLPGAQQERDGVIRRGAKLLHAFGEAVVPRVTLIIRKSYGGAYIAMNSRALGATAVFAWPEAEVAVMGPAAAVRILHRKALAGVPAEQRDELEARLIETHRRTAGGITAGLELGLVDEIIDPAHTRRRICEALAAAPAASGRHGNIPL
jgi:acetyl-CoA/propionyl-CoA carboxylase carboxyl transferase subunit